MIRKTLMIIGIMLVSTSAFAGYISLTGNVERISMAGSKWNAAGGGVGLGLEITHSVYIEPYFDFMKHINPQGALGLTGADLSMYSMHFGGKIAIDLVKILYIKVGLGAAKLNISSPLMTGNNTGTDTEVVANAGIKLPLAPMMDLTLGITYRKLFDSVTVYMIGGQGGLSVKF